VLVPVELCGLAAARNADLDPVRDNPRFKASWQPQKRELRKPPDR
jgi:hypothetical protein